MSQDPFGRLSDDWYTNAGEADKWKGRFGCCNEFWDILEPIEEGCKIKGGRKTEKAMLFFIQWLDVEQHVFTRVKLLQIFTKVLPGLNPSIYEKKNGKLAEALMKQWVEKKVFRFVTPVLVVLWQKCGEIGKWNSAVTNTLASANPVVKGAFWSFLATAAETDPAKAKDEWKKLLKSGEVLDAAVSDTDNRNNDTKKNAIRFLSSVAIFLAKDKEKKFIKKVNALCDEDAKKKSAIDTEKENMRAIMKKNAIAIKKSKKGPQSAAKGKSKGKGGDDEKQSGAQAPSGGAPSNANNNAGGGGAAAAAAPGQYVANAASNEEVKALKEEIAKLNTFMEEGKAKIEELNAFMVDEKQSRNRRRLIVGSGASIHDLFENFLLNTIGMPHYLERFKTAGANDIRMVEHFDVPFLKETIGVQNKLEGKLLVKFIGKFNEETMQFREWLKKQNVMRAYVNTFESKGIITWGILSDYCETIEAVQEAFRIKNKAHAHFLYTQLERYRNGELSDAPGDSDSDSDSDDSDSESDSDDNDSD
eukprot:28660_1